MKEKKRHHFIYGLVLFCITAYFTNALVQMLQQLIAKKTLSQRKKTLGSKDFLILFQLF